MSRVETIGDATLVLADCREWLAAVPPCFRVDAVVTSPPYAQQRDYGQKVDDWRALVSGALSAIPDAGRTQVLVNLGLIHRDGEVLTYWQPLIDDMRNCGWRLFGWYVWDKGFGLPGNWSGRLAPAHEFIFHFNKDAVQPNKWVRTQDRKPSGNGLRRADGSMSGISSPELCGQPFKIPDSVIRIPPQQARGGIECDHPATFPVAFAGHLASTFSQEGGIVLDPFMGSGTTGVACAKLGRKFIGIEIEPAYYEIALRRIEAAYAQPRLFAEPVQKPEQLELSA